MSALKQTFRPEFLNRIDQIVVFEQLSKEDITKIARLMLNEVKVRLDSMKIHIDFDDSLIEKLSLEGFDPVYGARPLRRAIMRIVEDGLSRELLEGKIKEGDFIRCSMEGEKVIFEKLDK